MSGFIYLASPYWHEKEIVRIARANQARLVVAELLAAGYIIYSPIAHNHAIAPRIPEPLRHSHDFWMGVDLPILSCARALAILTLEGWEESVGIKREHSHAMNQAIPVFFISPEEPLRVDPSYRINPHISKPTAPGVRPDGAAGTRRLD